MFTAMQGSRLRCAKDLHAARNLVLDLRSQIVWGPGRAPAEFDRIQEHIDTLLSVLIPNEDVTGEQK